MESLGRRLRASIERSIDEHERQKLLVFLESLKLAITDQIEAGDTDLVYELTEAVYEVRSPLNPLNELWIDFEDWLRHNDLSSSLRAEKGFSESSYSLAVYPSRFGPSRKKVDGGLAETWLEKLMAKPDVTDGTPDEPGSPATPDGQ
ncbi:hypothetical protein [Pedomonas mirosovicensis]|uniref:hypothetical protein n=1 Tax=Pedomonas mirosovicensis TaxID=2908641 RepID=UPI0021676BB7|nr:hypothetical protein [Pedomonas mirosovicensis]MCH8685181.1 hypothetical protein [Pedomonas mirosovicensis]